MEYRVVRKHRRDEDEGRIKESYAVEELCTSLFSKKQKWVPVTVIRSYGMDSYSSPVVFTDQDKAIAYVRFLETPTPPDRVVYP